MASVLKITEYDGPGLQRLVELAQAIKADPDRYRDACDRKGLLLLFQKTSTRTLLAFSSAIEQLGGYAVRLGWNESNFAISPIEYEARYVSRNCDAVMARLLRHEDVAALAAHSSVPVINGCCNRYHPSQALADLLTVHEVFGGFDVTVTYVGVHNNVANSLVAALTSVGARVVLVTPIVNEAAWDADLMERAEATGLVSRASTLAEAAAESDVVYTDTWIDMEFFDDPGYREARDERIALMQPFQVNAENLGGARPHLMHDMPIHPGFEIDVASVDDERSVIFQQAENRLHAAKALLVDLIGSA